MAGSVDGLISGMNTTDVISQLMMLERQPQRRLQTQKAEVERLIEAYRSINKRIAATGTAAAALTGDKSWQLARATSTDAARVMVTATAGAATGSMSFSVQQLATAAAAVTSGSVSSPDDAVADGPILLAKGAGALGIATLDQGAALAPGKHSLEVTKDTAGKTFVSLDGHTPVEILDLSPGAAFSVTNADGDTITGTVSGPLKAGTAAVHNVDLPAGATLQQVAEAIGKAGAGVTAAAVQVSTGVHRLQLSSTTTGAASDLMLDADAFTPGTLGDLQVLSAPQDAVLRVGSGAGAYDVTRSTNTVSDLMPGVTMTLAKADAATTVTVDVKKDDVGLADRVSRLVDAANEALNEMRGLTAYDATTKKAGFLVGDGMVRRLQSDLIQAVTAPVAGGSLTSAGAAGVTVDRHGKLTFDRAAFLEQYAKDPAAVEALFGPGTKDANGDVGNPGVAGRLQALDKRITDATNGLLPSSIKTRQVEVNGFASRVASWDARLELRERKLKNQFAAMETALGKMQQQSQWLAGQLASLPMMGRMP